MQNGIRVRAATDRSRIAHHCQIPYAVGNVRSLEGAQGTKPLGARGTKIQYENPSSSSRDDTLASRMSSMVVLIGASRNNESASETHTTKRNSPHNRRLVLLTMNLWTGTSHCGIRVVHIQHGENTMRQNPNTR